MITCERILKNPQASKALTGMSPAEFEKFYEEFELAHRARLRAMQCRRRDGANRQRAVGAGRKYKYALCDRLLMTLFWLRAYTTYEVLAKLYNLNKTTIEENLKSVMHTLSSMGGFKVERPHPEVPKLRSVHEVMHAFPDVLLVIDPERYSMD